MSTIILKNDSTAEIFINDLGIGIPAKSERNLTELFSKQDIARSDNIDTLVYNQNLIVNDGTEDLSPILGLKHVNFQTEYEDSFDEAIETNLNPPDSTNVVWINAVDNYAYAWDVERKKWLSVARSTYVFSKDGFADNVYLNIGGVANEHAGYFICKPATIVLIYLRSTDGDLYKPFTLENNHDIIFSFSYNGEVTYLNNLADVNLPCGSVLQCKVSGDGGKVYNTILQVEVAWRYEP